MSVAADLYEQVRAYHETHGDDYGSESSREKKYRAVRSLLPRKSQRTLLDVGCGTRQFQKWVPGLEYTGIDLVEGVNVMEYDTHADYVVANGLVYKLPDIRAAKRLLAHCWELADEAFVWTSLDCWAIYRHGELALDPYEMARWARRMAGAGRVAVRMDYLPHDFTVLMLR